MNIFRTVVFVSASLAVLLALTINAELSLAESEPVTVEVLFDTGHELDAANMSGYSTMITDLGSRGFIFNEDSDGDITAEDLKGKHVLVIIEPDDALSNDEINNIHGFIETGHGLLLLTDELCAGGISAVNKLLSPYRIQQSTSTALSKPGDYTDIMYHAITSGISRYNQGSPGARFEIVSDTASPIIRDISGNILAAAWEGSGRVVVISDEGSFCHSSYNNSDNYKLMRNIFDWLSHVVPPKAEFSSQPVKGEGPLNVRFTDESIGYVDSWAWDFGDGTTSNIQSPDHLYYHAGRYTVTLEVTGVHGTSKEVKQSYVHVTQGPGEIAGISPSTSMTFSAKIDPIIITAEEKPTVSMNVYNRGDSAESYKATLSINDKLEDVQIIFVPAGVSKTIVFNTSTVGPGLYELSIGGNIVQFVVTDSGTTQLKANSANSGITSDAGLVDSKIGAIVAGSTGVALAALFIARRRRRKAAFQEVERGFKKLLDDLNNFGKND